MEEYIIVSTWKTEASRKRTGDNYLKALASSHQYYSKCLTYVRGVILREIALLPVWINIYQSPILVFSAFVSVWSKPCLMCQAYIVTSQAGFTSSKELTMGVITTERWETSLLFSYPQEMFTKTYWSSLWLWTPPIHHPIELNLYYKGSSWTFSVTSAHLSVGKDVFWNEKWGDVMLVITDLLFLELGFHHFNLWGWGFLIDCELLYLTDPCEQSFQVLEKCLRICWHIP